MPTSWSSPFNAQVHPCVFYSKKLSPAECSFYMGDGELLAVKQALEEWRNWLKGVEHPLMVWTNHKNLPYIQTAKRLNSWQASWVLFISRFQFTLTYCPGSWNIKRLVIPPTLPAGGYLFSRHHPVCFLCGGHPNMAGVHSICDPMDSQSSVCSGSSESTNVGLGSNIPLSRPSRSIPTLDLIKRHF